MVLHLKRKPMSKIYQPFIISMADDLVNRLETITTFFTDEDIKSTDFTKQIVCDKLTEKFINGDLSSDDDVVDVFDETEFKTILNSIVVKNALDSLVKSGLIDVIDEDGDERYFITEIGKQYAINNDLFSKMDKLKK